MTLPAKDTPQKIDFSPYVRGRLTENVPLGAQSWFRCGGAADLVFNPVDEADIQNFIKKCPPDYPVQVLGGLANTIIRDGGMRGAVIRPDKTMARVKAIDQHTIYAQTGALNGTVAAFAMKAQVSGLEFLSGIPGCLGGALAMNAGAYGREIKDVLVSVRGITRGGALMEIAAQDMIMSYRYTELPYGLIVTSAILRGTPAPYEDIRKTMNDIKTRRNETQPIREKTGGSTFANPSSIELRHAGLPENTRAWQIVDMVGGRGLMVGEAKMSDKHCNFMVNTGEATAHDLEALGEEIRTRAYDRFGLKLRWEIKRIGKKSLND
jgi:UDP-N-acetylmuramate dehydrogenase